jgi:hemolysin-activating ACP:hemolysin acyltransferase
VNAPRDPERYALCQEILQFLDETPGIYRDGVTDRLYSNLVQSLYNGQYLLFRDDAEKIVSFLNYWLIYPEEFHLAAQGKPLSTTTHGSMVWVVDMGTSGGRRSFTRMAKELRHRHRQAKGIGWRHKGMKTCCFPGQKGVESG